jgi:hypothetical protein
MESKCNVRPPGVEHEGKGQFNGFVLAAEKLFLGEKHTFTFLCEVGW